MKRRLAPVAVVLLALLGSALAWALRRPPPAAIPRAAPVSGLPSFLVIVPDTFRADRLGRSVNGVPVTPNLDRLARRGVTFAEMYSQAGWTMPALASLLTGRYPLAPPAEADRTLDFMRTDLPNLPELLQAAGYRTAVFWGPFMSEAPAEFSRGFEHVAHEEGERFDEGVVRWLTEADRRPFFALVHNSDLQFPVVPVPGHPVLATVDPAAAIGLEPVFQVWLAKFGFEAARQAAPVAYDATVSRYDAAIGRMVAGLDAAGLTGETVVVVTSNHGIELGEHGHYKHGSLFEYDLHVPLLVADPTMAGPGRVERTLVQTMDVAPTLLERAGRRADADVAGRSFLSLVTGQGEPYAARDVYSLSSASTMSVRSPRWKVLKSAPKGATASAAETRCFDLLHDPKEIRPGRPPCPPEAAALITRLEAWQAERLAEADAAHPSGADPAALKRLLQDHGYWGVFTGEEAQTGGKPTAP